MFASAATLAQQLTDCVLRPADFAALRTGQLRAEFADRLPGQEFAYAPDAVRSAPKPVGARCELYRSNGNVLEQVDVYRLCFTGSRLTSKDVLPGRS
jgi:hypothetical protein